MIMSGRQYWSDPAQRYPEPDMRVLLIATNRHHRLMSRMDARPLPIGLAYVAGHLDQTRHSVKVLDLMFSGDDAFSVRKGTLTVVE